MFKSAKIGSGGFLGNLGYLIVFFVFLFFFTLIKFPFGSLEQRMISEIEENAPIPIVVEDLEYKFPSGFHFKNVTVVTKSQTKLKFDSIKAKIALISLITSGQIKVPFDAKLLDGKVDGTIYYLKDQKRVNKVAANIHSINSESIPSLFSADTPLEVDGKLSGNINLTVPLVDGKRMPNGSYVINSEKLTIRNFEINKIKFDEEYKDLKSELRGSIAGLTTNIDNLSFVNKDIELSFQGQMPTPWKLKKGAKIDLTMNLLLNSSKAKLALLKAFLKPHSDGSLRGRIFGPVSSPKLVNSSKKITGSGI